MLSTSHLHFLTLKKNNVSICSMQCNRENSVFITYFNFPIFYCDLSMDDLLQ